jgi:hypothetical protein
METGVEVHAIAARAGLKPVEVYPHAAVRELAGGVTPPKKMTPAGMRSRVALLRAAGVVEPALPMWSRRSRCGAMTVSMRRQRRWWRGTPVTGAQQITCGHDDSSIWLPAPRHHRHPAAPRS